MMRHFNFHNRLEASTRAQNILAIVIILFFAVVNIVSVRREYSQTRDEDKHYLYGQNILNGNSTRFDDSKMPVSALNALPAKLAELTRNERLIRIGSRFYIARSITIFFSCLLAFLVFYWSRSLYGFIPAIFSLMLYVLDPNIIAHSQLVTTDIYAAGTTAFAFFCLWRFVKERSWRNGLLCALALGISQLAKYTAIALFPLFLASLIAHDLYKRGNKRQGDNVAGKLLLQYAKYVVVGLLVVILILNVGFLFNQTFTPLGEYTFRSKTFRDLQDNFLILTSIPVPVPYPYVQGLDLIRYYEQSGGSYGNIYFLGRISPLDGFPGYYFVASALKVPIAAQIIMIMALILYFARKDQRSGFFRDEIFLLISVVFFAIYFNFFYNTQIGIRHFLPVFPLLYVFSGNLFAGWQNFSSWQKLLSWGLILYMFVSVFSYYPHNISYFNEIVWDREQAYKYLADSNIDWGQSQNEFWEYVSNNPDVIYPEKVQAGRLVVSVNDLVGITIDPGKYAWLRENFEPVGTISYSYLIYDISPAEIDALCNTTDYCEN